MDVNGELNFLVKIKKTNWVGGGSGGGQVGGGGWGGSGWGGVGLVGWVG